MRSRPLATWNQAIHGTTPTPRQIDVLELAATGMTNAEIGRELRLSEETVKAHVKSLLRLAGARNRTQLVWLSLAHGWLEAPSQSE